MLDRIVHGEVHEQRVNSADDQLMLGQLRNAGLVTRDTEVTVTDDVRVSLGLDD
jgi:hypothetical protein